MNKPVEDMTEDEPCPDVLRLARERVIRAYGRPLMMERANQIVDPNVRLPIKYLLEHMK